MSEPGSRKNLILCGIAVLILGIIIGSVSLTYPFGRDQGIYAYAGKLILDGKVDYKYSYDVKPPAIHYVFALGQLLGGKSMLAMRLIDLMWQISTALIIFLIALKLTGLRAISIFSAVLYIFLYYRLSYWHTLQTEGMLNFPMALGVYLLLKERGNVMAFGAGLLFGLSVLFKYTIFSFLPFLVILIFINKRTGTKEVLAFSSGMVLFFSAVLLYYFLNDAVKEFFDIQFREAPNYARISSETETSDFIKSQILWLVTRSPYAVLVYFTVFFFVLTGLTRKIERTHAIIFIWLLSSFISLAVQLKFYTYHYLVIIPSLCVSAALFLWFLTKKIDFKRHYLKYGFALFLIAYVLIYSKPYHTSFAGLYSVVKGDESLKSIYTKVGVTDDSVFTIKKIFEMSDYIRSSTAENETVFIWGIEPLLYYTSGRDCASRFIYNTPLYWKGMNPSYRAEFMNEIRADLPGLILVAKRDPIYYITGYHETSEQVLLRFPELRKFLETGYNYKFELAEFDVYEVKKAG